jgi:PAS domain-containing protein
MRIKQSRSRSQKVTPAPLPQRRRSKRRSASGGSRGMQPLLVQSRAGSSRTKIEPVQWLVFAAIGLISLTLIVLIWTLTSRAIDDQVLEIRARTDQQVKSVAFVLAREVQDELQLVDQSLKIIQDDWTKNAGSVDLGAWRKELLALTGVADDIFIANEQGIIVQGTLPQSIGQGFGTAYVTYPNGSLETFEPDGTKNPDGKAAGEGGIQARQFLTYIARPLALPKNWMVGASYRSEGITKLFAGARLGPSGVVGLVALRRGGLQAIVGPSAQFGNMDISQSELIEQMRKNEAGVWAGVSPIDKLPHIIAYQHVPGRDMSVVVGLSLDTALQPLAALAAMAQGLAALGSLVVLVVAGIVVWTIATARAVAQRQRMFDRSELNLTNTRQELAVARARALLTEPEVGTLLSSATDGVARLDGEQRLRLWNQRFADLAGVPLDESAVGSPIEDLLRRQATAGVFGDGAEAEEAIATRLTILHTSGGSAVPPTQIGQGGEQITMYVRGVADGGHLIILTGPENARFATLPPLPAEAEPETADETTEW